MSTATRSTPLACLLLLRCEIGRRRQNQTGPAGSLQPTAVAGTPPWCANQYLSTVRRDCLAMAQTGKSGTAEDWSSTRPTRGDHSAGVDEGGGSDETTKSSLAEVLGSRGVALPLRQLDLADRLPLPKTFEPESQTRTRQGCLGHRRTRGAALAGQRFSSSGSHKGRIAAANRRIYARDLLWGLESREAWSARRPFAEGADLESPVDRRRYGNLRSAGGHPWAGPEGS